jgi:hypothetical protein
MLHRDLQELKASGSADVVTHDSAQCKTVLRFMKDMHSQ